MTPQEKSKELIDKFLNKEMQFPYLDTQDGRCIGSGYMTYQSAIRCALIAVDEIISLNAESFDSTPNNHHYFSKNYWQEVKNELLKQQNNG